MRLRLARFGRKVRCAAPRPTLFNSVFGLCRPTVKQLLVSELSLCVPFDASLTAQNLPFYRIFAADSRAPRDGRHIEIVGHYNPIPGELTDQ